MGDDGATWLTTTKGGATSPIAELTWRPNNRTMMVTTHGRGIYTVDVGEPASVKSIGGGCGKSATPVLGATLPIPGKTQTYTMTGATANAPVVLMFAPATTPVVLQNNCTLQVGWSPIFVSTGRVGSNGAWTFGLPIPPLKDIIGTLVTVQAAAFVTAGPALGIAELSNGLELLGGL